MLDVEFISELVSAMLHGLQNKKQNLDKYFEIYEEEFEEAESIEEKVTTILQEIVKILPEIDKTRWRKKTDFYTLFLVFHSHIDELPLNKEQRTRMNEILINFGKSLDDFVKSDPEKELSFQENVRKYGAGIRSATDLGSRKRRDEGLKAELQSIWNDNQQ